MPYTDLFLYDLKCFDNKKHFEYTGVSNELILENLKKLLKNECDIWIRIPIIKDFNDSLEEMKKIKDFFQINGFPKKIELLPYHKLGEHKYAALGKMPPPFSAPDSDTMKKLKDFFK